MYAQKKSIDNVHIVRERDRQRLRDLVTVVLVGLPIGLFLALFTYQNLEVIRLGHEATRLQKRRAEIENENKALQLELDRLTSLQSVEQKAAKLGFERTDARAVVKVEKKSVTVVKTACERSELARRSASRSISTTRSQRA